MEGSEEDWEVTLVLDSREVRTLQDRAFLQNRLQQVGVTCDVRAIALGDMQWVLRSRSGQEIMLSTIVERKNMRDLAMSIVDGRFNESSSDWFSVSVSIRCIWWKEDCGRKI